MIFSFEVRDLRTKHLEIVVGAFQRIAELFRLGAGGFPPLVHEAVGGAFSDGVKVDSCVSEYLDCA